MANEFNVNIQVNFSSSLSREEFSESFQDDQATPGLYSAVVAVTTSCAAVSEGPLTTPKWVSVKNLDPSNFVTLGPDSGGVMIPALRVDPGESNAFTMSTETSWRWRADTATVRVQLKMWER